jgi:hypothetical protein
MEYMVTFGPAHTEQHKHPLVHHRGWGVVEADTEIEARFILFSVFGRAWAFIYDEETWAKSFQYLPYGAFSYGELFRIDRSITEEEWARMGRVTLHRNPIDDSGLTPCCGRFPDEIVSHRMTDHDDMVTCNKSKEPEE